MPSEPTDLQALEQFVVDNDKLLDLEARIGRFNIFDALRIVDQEIRHSNFLAWLLDPGESHAIGGLFLNAVLMDLLRKTPVKDRLFSPIKLDGGELRGVEVRREWKNIDLLITCKDPSFVIAIENKVRSKEHSDQLARYVKTIASDAQLSAIEHKQYVYLTREGDEPSEDEWTVYSYAHLHGVLKKVRNFAGAQMGEDVKTFLDHYLRLIGSRFMNDEKIDELCEDIYKNHRQAIDLIIERIDAGQPPALRALHGVIKEDDRWSIVHQTGREIMFIPSIWLGEIPQIAVRSNREWLYLAFNVWQHACGLNICMLKTDPPEFRQSCFELWMENPKKYGFRKRIKPLAPGWNSLNRHSIAKWGKNTEPPIERIKNEAITLLDKLAPKLDEILAVIKQVEENA